VQDYSPNHQPTIGGAISQFHLQTNEAARACRACSQRPDWRLRVTALASVRVDRERNTTQRWISGSRKSTAPQSSAHAMVQRPGARPNHAGSITYGGKGTWGGGSTRNPIRASASNAAKTSIMIHLMVTTCQSPPCARRPHHDRFVSVASVRLFPQRHMTAVLEPFRSRRSCWGASCVLFNRCRQSPHTTPRRHNVRRATGGLGSPALIVPSCPERRPLWGFHAAQAPSATIGDDSRRLPSAKAIAPQLPGRWRPSAISSAT
jgi:hypothetical protein